jgi:hypothetical protein
MTKTFTVTPCDFHGKNGWAFDGFAGETPREAIYCAALLGSTLVTENDAFAPAIFIDASTGATMTEN